MGQAKLRGSFEQRKLEAIKRQEEERIKRLKERAEKEKNMTPEEKKRQVEARLLYSHLFTMAAPYINLWKYF